ncbi:MAG: D-aminoacyl-tRNA deacylase [Halobacteriales archaeon]
MLGIVVSRADEASTHVAERLLALADWRERRDPTRPDAEGGGTYYAREGVELREFEKLHLYLEEPATAFSDPDLLVFVSRHAGETGALLTAHFTGNVGPADHGGADGDLARAAPGAHDRVLAGLDEHAPEGYEVGMECTHHGPSRVGAPSMFVEVGSAEPQWRDPEAAGAVARAVLDLAGTDLGSDRTVVGFGGSHYAPRFTRIARETDWAIGHVAADWGLDAMDGADIDRSDVIEQMFGRSGATRAVIDGERPAVERTVDELGYETVSETWVREISGVHLGLLARLEDVLVGIESGLRLGDPAVGADRDAAFEMVTPDPDLLTTLHGIDAERTRRAVAANALAFETAEGGSRVAGSLAVPPGAYDDLLEAFCGLLSERFESVKRAGGELTVTERAFDPVRARELGVPEGPAFGKLADWTSVDVDGRTIDPSDVHVRERITYTGRQKS